MKKLLAALLCAVLLLTGIACAEETPEDRLLAQWMDYLVAMESECSEMIWAAGACEKFLEQPTWESLTYARAAVGTSAQRALSRGFFRERMTGEDYAALLKEYRDLTVIVDSMQNYISSQKVYPNPMIGLEGYVECHLLWEVYREGVTKDLPLQRELAELKMTMCAQLTKKLLLELDSPAEAEFLAQMQAHCPIIASRLEGLPEDGEAVTQQYEASVEAMVSVAYAMEEAYNLMMNGQDLYLSAVQAQDVEFIVDNVAWIDDMPRQLPYPMWYDRWTRTAEWTWSGEADPMADASVRPVCCVMTCPDVTKQDFLSYREEVLAYCGKTGWQELAVGECVEDGTSCMLAIGGVQLRWENDAVQINMPAEETGFAEYIFALFYI